MTDESKTGGNVQPISTEGSQPATATAAAAPTDTGVSQGVQQRIDQIIARSKTAIEQAEARAIAAERRANELEEANKDERQKAMDAFASEHLNKFKATEYGPLAASAEQMKAVLEAQTSALRERIPEDKRPTSFDALPLVAQFEAYKALADSLGNGGASAPSITSGGNPGMTSTAGKVWKLSEINANSGNREWYAEHGPDIRSAQKEGRILYDK